MTPRQIASFLQSQFPGELSAVFVDDPHPRIHIDAAHWRNVANTLRHEAQLDFDWLASLAGADYVADDKLAIICDLRSFSLRHRFAVKVYCPRREPMIPSVCDLWPAANWHEREAFDLFGIHFTGHPDPRRLLLADDWVGYPLRKDYVFPREYHGIPGSVELDWQQKPNYPK